MKAWELQSPSSRISWRDAGNHSGYDNTHDQGKQNRGHPPRQEVAVGEDDLLRRHSVDEVVFGRR